MNIDLAVALSFNVYRCVPSVSRREVGGVLFTCGSQILPLILPSILLKSRHSGRATSALSFGQTSECSWCHGLLQSLLTPGDDNKLNPYQLQACCSVAPPHNKLYHRCSVFKHAGWKTSSCCWMLGIFWKAFEIIHDQKDDWRFIRPI